MKKLNSIEEVKKFSIALQKFLKEKNIDIKHSLMLEGIASSFDLKDWNTLSALLKEEETQLSKTSFSYSHEKYIHIDNGGYHLRYDNETHILQISTSFFGYTNNTHFINLNDKTLSELTKKMVKFQKYLSNLKDYEEENYPKIKKETEWKLEHNDSTIALSFNGIFVLEVDNGSSIVQLNGIGNDKVLKDVVKFFNDISNAVSLEEEPFIYPLTKGLLASMALRNNHGFGLLNENVLEDKIHIDSTLKYIENIYLLFKEGLTNEEIVEKTRHYLGSIKQLREEVDGTGFYSPQREGMYKNNTLFKK